VKGGADEVRHELLPATPTPEFCAVIWFHIVSGYIQEKKDASTRFHVGEKEWRKVSFRLTGYDFDASRVTCSDHVLVLGLITAFGREDVRNGLIIRPPFGTLNMFLRRAH
jgi:hypothetical protein